MIPDLTHAFYLAVITTVVWFLLGALLYMNPPVAKVFRSYEKHPSMKTWGTQRRYLLGVFVIAGLIPVFFTAVAYEILKPIDWMIFGFLLCGIRIIPRCCDMWMQTSYPDKILLIELVNGVILSFVIAFMFSVL